MNFLMPSLLRHTAMSMALAVIMPTAAMAASGTVEFEGEIVQSSCDVTGASKDQTVVIGTYPTSVFANVGDVSASTAFTLGLENCEPTNYTVRFDGPAPAGHPSLLSVSEATGVGIEILDFADRPFPINQSIDNPASVEVSPDGSATVNLKARYKSYEPTVTAGQANATSTFSIEYR